LPESQHHALATAYRRKMLKKGLTFGSGVKGFGLVRGFPNSEELYRRTCQNEPSPTYAALCPLQLNGSIQRDEFLRAMARQLGIGKAEFLRRILADAVTSWTQEGLYVPSTQNEEQASALAG
jgi:hypothetical protein